MIVALRAGDAMTFSVSGAGRPAAVALIEDGSWFCLCGDAEGCPHIQAVLEKIPTDAVQNWLKIHQAVANRPVRRAAR